MARPSKKRRSKARTKRWDNPVQNVNSESEEEEDGSIQNDKNKETEAEMNLDMTEDNKGKESVQCTTIIQKEFGTEEHTDLAQEGPNNLMSHLIQTKNKHLWAHCPMKSVN